MMKHIPNTFHEFLLLINEKSLIDREILSNQNCAIEETKNFHLIVSLFYKFEIFV